MINRPPVPHPPVPHQTPPVRNPTEPGDDDGKVPVPPVKPW
jgi:hypothetical protein